MMECVRLIIGEGGERERDKRSVDRLIQSNLDGREGTAMLGSDKEGAQSETAETTFSRTPREV